MPELATLSLHPPPDGAVRIRCIAFDFARKRDEDLPYERLGELGDRYLWIDVEVVSGAEQAVVAWLAATGLVQEILAREALFHVSTTHLARFDQYIHLVLSACVMSAEVFGA